LFKLDDKSGVIDARADEALINTPIVNLLQETTNSSLSWASCSRIVFPAACS
jgi:hypothetical protein